MTRQWYTTAAMKPSARTAASPSASSATSPCSSATSTPRRRFYRDVLGLAETGTGKNGRIVFFSAGVHHHDLSCELARAEGPGPQPKGVPGLYHVAFIVGTTLDDLAAARALGRVARAGAVRRVRRAASACATPTATRSSCTWSVVASA